MCGIKGIFSELDKSLCFLVTLGNKAKFVVFRKEKIGIKLKDGSINFISNAFYVPSLYKNLLCVAINRKRL